MSPIETWQKKWPVLSKLWGTHPDILKTVPKLVISDWKNEVGNMHSKVSLYSSYGGNILEFTLMYYPSCCASMLMHNFKIDDRFFPDEEELHKILEEIFNEAIPKRRTGAWFANRRIIGVFVERGRHDEMMKRREKGEDLRLVDIVFIDNPKIEYNQFRDYFKKQPRYSERLFLNENTNYIMHEFEVVLPH